MDVKLDKNRFNRYNRVHLPDVLKGPNQFLTGALTAAFHRRTELSLSRCWLRRREQLH